MRRVPTAPAAGIWPSLTTAAATAGNSKRCRKDRRSLSSDVIANCAFAAVDAATAKADVANADVARPTTARR